MIYYGCPKCQTPMASPDSMAGQAERCPECGNVAVVPATGAVVTAVAPPPTPAESGASRSSQTDRELIKVHPSLIRGSPVAFAFCCLLSPVGIGLAILLAMWLECRNTTLIITETRVILRKGILSKRTVEVRHHNVREITVEQGVFQRLFDCGDIGISTAASTGVEISVCGLPYPQRLAEMVRTRQA
jgi:membrane protein YdbS with pleckstrin-like domain